MFAKYAHDRFIFFDYQVIELGSGLEVFQKNKFKSTTFSLKCKTREHKSMLEKLSLESEDKYKWIRE
jgi:hypothetical protein